MMKSGRTISIVVPLFNEAANLSELTSRIAHLVVDHPRFAWEILYVDDGSTDDSAEEMDRLVKFCPWLKVIHLSRNFGHQMAITAGMKEAIGDAVVLMDGDLQDPPELIPEMIGHWEKGFDVVYATRKKRKGESRFKLLTASMFYRSLNFLSEVSIPLDTGDFRLLSRTVVDALNQMPERNRFLRGMVSWAGFRQIAVEYDRDPRFQGSTKYTFRRMLRLALDGILSFSNAPLRSVFLLGAILCFLSIPGMIFHPMMMGMFFLGGLQLIGLGIVGAYVGRIFEEVRQRPNYLVRQVEPQNSVRHKTSDRSLVRVTST